VFGAAWCGHAFLVHLEGDVLDGLAGSMVAEGAANECGRKHVDGSIAEHRLATGIEPLDHSVADVTASCGLRFTGVSVREACASGDGKQNDDL
jgi:hypothetical protein